MYTLNAPAVYAHKSVMGNPVYRARVERVVAALKERREVIPYADNDVPRLIREDRIFRNRVIMGTRPDMPDPILLFNTFRFGDDDAAFRAREASWKEAGVEIGHCRDALLGTGAFCWKGYNQKGDPNRHDKVCRPCWCIHLQDGCLHKCAYCGTGGLLVSMVNVEEYCENLGRLIEQHPWQKAYLIDDDADPICLEPEMDCLGRIIEFFGTLKDRYLIIHTKTWNTSWLKDLKHNGNTIIVWSLGGSTQSRVFEPNTGTMEQRIEAARIAEESGYQIRYKFKPIIPVEDWQRDAADAIELALRTTHPDVISLCVFMWMDVDELKRRFASVLDRIDPRFLAAAEEGRTEVAQSLTKPFPQRMRAEIYDHYLAEIRKRDKDIPVSLSTESFDIWKDFAKKLGMNATNYVCGCGPQTTPGAKLLYEHPFTTAVKNVSGVGAVVTGA